MSESELVFPFERVDDLQCNGLKVIQDPKGFCFGTDAVLLAHFARVRRDDTVVDLGTGCGVIPILLSAHSKAKKLIGVEIEDNAADRAKRSVRLNALEDRVEIFHCDLKEAYEKLGRGVADVVLCNPPYSAKGASLHNMDESNRIARHEVCATLEDCVTSAGKLVKNGGRIAFIHRAERMLELCDLLRAVHAQPKRIRLVHPYAFKAPNLMLVEAVKLAKPGLLWLPPLIVRDENGDFTREMSEIYGT